jgi:uncharacterized protein YbjT (DUF2867 family)
MRILVAGSTGAVGRNLLPRLMAAGKVSVRREARRRLVSSDSSELKRSARTASMQKLRGVPCGSPSRT